MFSRIKNKKGLSNVVAVVLMVLLAVGSASLVSVIITKLVGDTERQLSPGFSCIDMQTGDPFELLNACRDFKESEIEIRIKRGLNFGEITSINFVISSGIETTTWIAGKGCDNCELPPIGGVETYFFPFANPENQKGVKLYVGSCEIDTRVINNC
jgi:hypothetical protein